MIKFRIVFLCALLALPCEVSAQGPSPILLRQNPRPLNLPPPAASTNQPESQTGQNELDLPQAVQQFVGKWGGHLYVLSTGGDFGASESRPESFTFGQRSDGTVYFETSIWGKTGARVVSARAKVLSPTKIEIRLEHLTSGEGETRTIVQKESILLKNPNVMDCIESDQIYRQTELDPNSSYEQPTFSAIYHGSLHQIGDSESQELEDELIRSGAVPQIGVEGSGKFAP